MPRQTDFDQTLCADLQDFSLHAVCCAAGEHQAMEQPSRYITRPALANGRVQTNAARQVVLRLKAFWRDSTRHLLGQAGFKVVSIDALMDGCRRRGRVNDGVAQWPMLPCPLYCMLENSPTFTLRLVKTAYMRRRQH